MSRFGLASLLFIFAFLPARGQAPPKDAAAALTETIDRHLRQRLLQAKVAPAPLADDTEYLRRVYLDLAGRIPSVAETRSFLADKRPDRRRLTVERLLSSPRYASHFASVYRDLLIPEAATNFFVRFQQGGFETWLKLQLADNVGYDRLTRELLTESIGSRNGLEFFTSKEPSARTFYAAKEYRPESLAAGAARVFLGVRVECAQCHNHPFAKWKREQFWSLAAFFSGIKSQPLGDVIGPGDYDATKKDIMIPGTDKVVQARFLDGSQPDWQKSTSTRATLADWITAPKNPYFARATVNRVWAYFFGTGLVEPIDEMIGTESASSHPELLNLLAGEFIEQKFDLKFLIRAITATAAYQRTSAGPRGEKGVPESQADPALFARMSVRGLTPEQLFDSLTMATGFRDSGDTNPFGEFLGKESARSKFLTKFANQTERPIMAQTSILQALSLMNGKITSDATSLEHSETLAALLDAPFLSTADRIETLYLAALSRKPNVKELDRTMRFIDDAVQSAKAGDDAKSRRVAYNGAVADVFWAILNSSEFVLNK